MAETIDSVFRDFNTPGNPGSGEYEPEKPRIRALLRQIEASGGQSVTRGTLSALNTTTPPNEDYMGVVLNDPNPSNNGYYYRDSGAWVKGRGFPDTFAELTLSGSANAQTGAAGAGVNPSDIEVFWARVLTENTGPMTLNGKPVLNVDGSALTGGEWTGTILFVDNGPSYQLIFDTQAARRAVESADRAEQEADRAEDEADRAAGYVNDIVAEKEVPIYSTISGMSAIAVPDGMGRVYVSGQSTVGDGLGGMFIDTDNGSPVAFTTAAGVGATARDWYRAGDVGDERLAAPANITYLNQTETTLEFYGGDAVEMFSVSPARKFSIGAGDIEVDEPFLIPSGVVVDVEGGARFLPTFIPTGAARDTALITLGEGSKVDFLEVYHAAGINTFPLDIQIGSRCQVGVARVTSAQYNNNVTDVNNEYHRWASVLIQGDDAVVGRVETDNCRVGLRVFSGDRVHIGHYQGRRVSLGFNPRNAQQLYLGSYDIEAVAYEDQTRTWNSNGVITGENGILVSGVHHGYFGPGRIVNALEHAIRVGAGNEITNHYLTFQSPRLFRPYGCGFKADDGDAHTTTDLRINDIYCEDVGRDNEVISDVPTSTWGNKESIAIRNVRYFQVNGAMTRARNFTYCGRYGLWIERSLRGSAYGLDLESANQDGIALTTNGIDMLDVTVRGRVAKSSGDNISIRPTQNSDTFNRVDVDVVAQDAGEYNLRVDDRPNGTAAFSGPVSVRGFARGAGVESKSIGPASGASTNFFDKLENS